MMKWGRDILTWQSIAGYALAACAFLALILTVSLRNYHPGLATYPQQGVDVSAAQGDIDWVRVHKDGASFAYLLATSGDAEKDPRFADHWETSRAAGLKRGAVHHYDLCRLAQDQATNFIATVPRDSTALPPVVDLDLEEGCTTRPARSVVVSEVAAFIRAVEAHSEKPAILRVSRAFESEFAISRAIDRPLWLSSFLFTPSYGERRWLMWRANSSAAVDGIEQGRVSWSVVRP
jgi:lysozyme